MNILKISFVLNINRWVFLRIILLIMLFSLSQNLKGCRLWAIYAKDNFTLSTLDETSKNLARISNPVVEVEDPQFDVHNFLGLESGLESYVSFPANRVNIPEVHDATGTFVYNYFTKDERERSTSDNSDKVLDLQLDFSNEIYFQLSNDKLPRFVKLEF